MAIYYIKSGGNDSLDGLSDATAWGSESKITSGSFSAGDRIRIKNDGGVYGDFTFPSSGSSGNPIVVETYGEGQAPSFLGGIYATGWNDEGGKIWSFQNASMVKDPKMVRFDASLKPRARTEFFTISAASATEEWVETNDFRFNVSGITLPPNVGDSFTNNSSTFYVTKVSVNSGSGYIHARRTAGSNDPQASGTLSRSNGISDATITFSSYSMVSLPDIDYTGAHIVVRNRRFIFRASTQISRSSNRITYGSDMTNLGEYDALVGFGFFLQNHLSFLKNDGDWMYNTATNTLYMYFENNSPSEHEVFVAVKDNVVNFNNKNYVTVTGGLKFLGSVSHAIRRQNCIGVNILGCEIAWCGDNAITNSDNTSNYCAADGNIIHDCHSNGIYADYLCHHMTANNNIIYNCGLFAGASLHYGNTDSKGLGICLQLGAGNEAKNNHISYIGFNPIAINGNGFAAEDNYCYWYNLTKDDGAGIYCSLGGTGQQLSIRGSIKRNICMFGVGNSEGTDDVQKVSFGIYADDLQNNVDIEDNLVAFNEGAGMYLHNTENIGVKRNTFFGNKRAFNLSQDNGLTIRNTDFSYNKIYTSDPDQFLISAYAQGGGDISQFGIFDYNEYFYIENNIGLFEIYGGDKYNYGVSFEEWKSLIGGENNSIITAYQQAIPSEYSGTNIWSRSYTSDGSQSGSGTGQFSLFGGGTRTWADNKAILTKTGTGKRSAYMSLGNVLAGDYFILSARIDSPVEQHVSLIPETLLGSVLKKKRIKSSPIARTHSVLINTKNSRSPEQLLWMFEDNQTDNPVNISSTSLERIDGYSFESDLILIENGTNEEKENNFGSNYYKNLATDQVSNIFVLQPMEFAILQKTNETPDPDPPLEGLVPFPFNVNLL